MKGKSEEENFCLPWGWDEPQIQLEFHQMEEGPSKAVLSMYHSWPSW